MKKNGATLLVYALEQVGVRKTFGIPGVYNSPIYDSLYKSGFIEPIIACSELSSGYMAIAGCLSTGSIGTIIIVQGAGITHSMSAIAQANSDGVPLLVIAGSYKLEGKHYQMHDLNLSHTLEGVIKQKFKIQNVSEIIPVIYQAYDIAINDTPGPVLIEIPLKVQMKENDLDLIPYQKTDKEDKNSQETTLFVENETLSSKIQKAAEIIAGATHPGLFLGWPAIDAFEEIKQLAEMLAIPVSTNLQGLSVFPYTHPLHAGVGFGKSAALPAKNALKNCDCLIAIGIKFSELDTANYQLPVPENLIHINPSTEAFYKNFHAKVAIAGDLKKIVLQLTANLTNKGIKAKNDYATLIESIKKDKEAYKKNWLTSPNEQLVSPGFFYNALRNYFPQETFLVLGNGSHRFLASELFPIAEPRHFICPGDLNTMGFGIPAAIGTKMLNKTTFVLGIVEEGGFFINGMEILTAHYYKLGLILFILRDWLHEPKKQSHRILSIEAGDQLQKSINLEQFAASIHAEYFVMKNDIDISGVLTKAKGIAKNGTNVIIEVRWDSSRKSAFSEALTRPDTSRLSLMEKIKFLFKSRDQ